jgi:hypothetical protein
MRSPLLLLLLAQEEGLVAARLHVEADAVQEARLRRLRDLLEALLLLHSGPVEASATAFVKDTSVDLRRVSASE